LRINYKDTDGFTKRKLEEERKKDMLDYNLNTFGRAAIGVHGMELPKFLEDQTTKEWWK
jgi:phage terminase small subunit